MVDIVGFKRRVIRFTPVVTASSAYTAGYQLGGLNTLNYAVEDGPVSELTSVTINDASKQKAAIDILFFNAAPTLAGDGVAFSVSAADMAAKFIGAVSIAAASYRAHDTGNGNDVTVSNVNLLLTEATVKNLYCVLQVQGTPTYATASALTVLLGFTQD